MHNVTFYQLLSDSNGFCRLNSSQIRSPPPAFHQASKIDCLCKIRQRASFSRHKTVFVCQQTHPGPELQPLTYLTAESSALTGRSNKAESHL